MKPSPEALDPGVAGGTHPPAAIAITDLFIHDRDPLSVKPGYR
jgi:hypothetical protein